MRRSKLAPSVVVRFGGVEYEMNLAACRRAFIQRQVDGAFGSMQGLADAALRSRSTASRFLSGRQVRLDVALAFLDKLNLEFGEVFSPPSSDSPPGP